ncbi:transcriptional regulator of RNA polII, SAGA, subunit-domain-containing protein, partial [Baffinella frigidus]
MSSEGSLPLGGGVKRVDVVALRKKIAVGLGQEKVRKYWDILIRFTQFKLSKEELDTHARQVLGADYIPLHNELIHGIFQNALVSTINPPTVETPAVPLDMGEPLAERPAKKPKKKVGPGGQ